MLVHDSLEEYFHLGLVDKAGIVSVQHFEDAEEEFLVEAAPCSHLTQGFQHEFFGFVVVKLAVPVLIVDVPKLIDDKIEYLVLFLCSSGACLHEKGLQILLLLRFFGFICFIGIFVLFLLFFF